MYHYETPYSLTSCLKKNITENAGNFQEESCDDVLNKIIQELQLSMKIPETTFHSKRLNGDESYWFNKIKNSWKVNDTQDTLKVFLRNLFQSSEIDLSFQNGLMGLLLRLSKENQQHQNLTIQAFLNESTNLILSKKMKINFDWEQFSFFPESFDDDTWMSENILSWAVGDLHIVKLLYRQALANPTAKYYELAENIGFYSSTRTQENQNSITDSSIINGSLGLVILYFSLYNETGQEIYLEAGKNWIKQTCKFLENDIKNGFYDGKENQFLSGLAGVKLIAKFIEKETNHPIIAWLAG